MKMNNKCADSIWIRRLVQLLTVIALFAILQWMAYRNMFIPEASNLKFSSNGRTFEQVIVKATDDGSVRDSGSGGSTIHVPECLYGKYGPTNVILMSRGRSGTTIIWQMLSTLTGYETESNEYVGKNEREIKNFFNRTVAGNKELTDGKWLTQHLCELQTNDELRYAAFVGIKWKPYLKPLLLPESQKTLELIFSMATSTATNTTRQQQFPGPPIRLLRSRRNVLDVHLSKLKHKEKRKEKIHINAHCLSTMTPETLRECLKVHEEGAKYLNPTELFLAVLQLWDEETRVDDRFRSMGIPIEYVSYDTLFYPANEAEGVKEWYKALQYVSPRGKYDTNMSLSRIFETAKHVSTSTNRSHKDAIKNWGEVYQEFKGTAIEHLLRLD